MKYIKGFDSIRAVGCLFVIFSHWGPWFDDTTPTGNFAKTFLFIDGRLFVNFFFVLSGFLITNILLTAKNADSRESNWHIFKSYFIRRGLRIYPLYFVLLFFLYAVNFPDVRENIIYFATFTSNLLIYHTYEWNQFCITWTLSIEEQLYLLWPLLLLLTPNKYLKHLFIIAILIGIGSTYYNMAVEYRIAPCLAHNCLDAFGLGGLFALVKTNDRNTASFEKIIKYLTIFCVFAYIYRRCCMYFQLPYPFFWTEKTIDSIISTWILIWVLNTRSLPVKKYFLENRVLNFVGKMSYSIYLFHDVYANGFMARVNTIFNNLSVPYPLIHRLVNNKTCNYGMHLSIILILSTASYLLLEKPMLKLKRPFTYKKINEPVPSIATVSIEKRPD